MVAARALQGIGAAMIVASRRVLAETESTRVPSHDRLSRTGSTWLPGCSSETPKGAGGTDPAAATLPAIPAVTRPRVLPACFSRAGENYHYGGRTYLEAGNTEVPTGMISGRSASHRP
ncbi:hypothetical protein [Nonomuraea sp. NPDC049784]|uniref:hypothetical protein n=1 Tax=Nonomuraea sp. NPDC049784 TaxID=3154361 RepID=UPI0033EB215C